MSQELKALKARCEQLEKQLALARKQADYYRQMTETTGKNWLQETDWLSKLIEDQKAVETALRESEEKYRLLIDNASDAIFIIQDGTVKFPNPRALEIGRELAIDLEVIPFISYVHPDDRQLILERHQKRMRGDKLSHSYSFRLLGGNGKMLWVDINAVLINWDNKPATLNFLRDITEQKKLEEKLQQLMRLDALGKLAGGVAHDFNNLLMGIQGNASLMLADLEAESAHFDCVKSIERCVERGGQLTKRLLGYARGGRYEVKVTDLNRLIAQSVIMIERTRKDVLVHTQFQKDLWMVKVDRGQIDQILFNLYLNASQAMPDGGRLYLKTENCELGKRDIHPYDVAPGRFVRIEVTDTGHGIDEKVRHRIFEPFYTTKSMGSGTGLGLASVFGIVKNHGGLIDVASKQGQGTSFMIYLPASDARPVLEREHSAPLPKGEETLLVVDDEAYIIDVVETMLSEAGYQVLIARGGREAIEMYAKHSERIDLVILDMVMPDIGGGQVFDAIRAKNPDVKVLLSSGYSVEGQAEKILERGCNGFIQKPYRMDEMVHKIRAILASQCTTAPEKVELET